MAVSDTTAASSASANAAAAAASATSSADIEQRFLKLLVTQLNNQDPLNPMQNSELTSQLAQMSTVSGIEKLNSTMSGLLSQSGASQVLQAASMIGYAVLSPGNELAITKDQATSGFAVELAGSAADVKVVISDADGKTVRTMEMGAMAAGVNGATWDGKNDAGDAVAAGAYTYSVVANNGSTVVKSTALSFSQVAAVKQSADGVSLELTAGRSISLSDVRMFL
ncbi:flagellar hook assembly protein FlgD [Variovorax sp. OV329]|uniref:flagellar hook assembly protein FlgD n=1 Tax=Variovorax sp. OV329 TaxID=1882825 RepID=UPI0008E54FAF|nr:flagellar hook capping FlgD N-terminal domain-containing protein [Variovorax sp. OV329]SFN18111.1 flagellar basal-body rod modification protein FlgD [Variovorax sp. OV329]